MRRADDQVCAFGRQERCAFEISLHKHFLQKKRVFRTHEIGNRSDYAEGIYGHHLTNLKEMKIKRLNFSNLIKIHMDEIHMDEIQYRRICIVAICFFIYFLAFLVFFAGVGF